MKTRKTSWVPLCIAAAAVLLFSSCSIQKLAINAVADALGGGSTGGSAFTTDNDPELVGDALPFALKLYETLLEQAPEHTGLLQTTGLGFVMYSNAYVQSPADTLPEWEFEKQEEMYARAKKLYLRGRDYIFRSLDIKYPGFLDSVESGDLPQFVRQIGEEDIDALYWGSAGWFAAIAINVFDFELTLQTPMAKAMMDRAYELNPDYGDGTLDDFYIMYYAGLPADMGGSDEKAAYHFKRAVEVSQGESASPYVSYALNMSIKKQNVEEFTSLLEKALAIDVDKNPETRMVNIVAQEKAKWFLEHVEDYFILEPEEGDEWE